jgi:predicted transcriptional regulator
MQQLEEILKIGIMPYEAYKRRMLDIAEGKYKPTPLEPKVWFNSLKPLAYVLNENDTHLLSLIEKRKPQSIKELAEISGRKPSNLSRILKSFERYGIVELKKIGKITKPIAKFTKFQIDYSCA